MDAGFPRLLSPQPWLFELPRRLTVGSPTRRKKNTQMFQPNEQLLHRANVNIIDLRRFARGSKNCGLLSSMTSQRAGMIDVE